MDEEETLARDFIKQVQSSQSHHVVRQIIVGAALANAEGLPEVFSKSQMGVKLEKRDRHSLSSNTDDSFSSFCSKSIDELESFKHKLMEDERLSQIYKLRHNFSDRYDNRAFIHPHGTTNYDYKAIKENRKEGLERFKNRTRKENYRYLRDHPEIRAMISLFIKKLLNTQPSDPGQYLVEFFATRLAEGTDFHAVLENEVKRISRYRIHKMKAAGRINLLSTSVVPDDPEEPPLPEADGNFLKKLNIGPLAKDFYFDGYRPKKKVSLPPEPPKPVKKKCKTCPNYCICVKGKGVRRSDYYPAKKSETCSDDPGSKRCSKSSEGKTISSPPMEGAEEDDDEVDVEEDTEGEEELEGEFEDYIPNTELAAEIMVDDIVSGLFGAGGGEEGEEEGGEEGGEEDEGESEGEGEEE